MTLKNTRRSSKTIYRVSRCIDQLTLSDFDTLPDSHPCRDLLSQQIPDCKMCVRGTNKPDGQSVPAGMASNMNTMFTSRPVDQYTGQSLNCGGAPMHVRHIAIRQQWNLALFHGSGNETFLATDKSQYQLTLDLQIDTLLAPQSIWNTAKPRIFDARSRVTAFCRGSSLPRSDALYFRL